MPDHHDLTLTVLHDGSRPGEVQDFARELANDLNREQGFHADLPTKDVLGAKGLDPQLGTVLIDIFTDPKVIAAFVSLVGVYLRRRPEFQFEIQRNHKKLRISARDFNQDQIAQLGKVVKDLLEK